jgi:Beta-lactamase enzyme family
MFCCRSLFYPLSAALVLLSACSSSKKAVVIPATRIDSVVVVSADSAKTDALLENLLMSYPQYFDSILANRKAWNTQIIYTQVNRGSNGVPVLKNYYFNVNPNAYFYPASTVKLPVAILALQRLNELKGTGINRATTMITEAGTGLQTAVYNDPTTTDGKPTIEHYIKKILLVSDNDAFNRLYEFLGPSYINSELQRKGYKDVQVMHRLQTLLPEAENRKTNPVKFLDASGQLLYQQHLQTNSTIYTGRNDSMGKAFYRGGSLVNGAMDFSKKNRISLEDLHNILISLLFPAKFNAAQRFNISEDDRNFLLKYMSQLPTESAFPPYAADTVNYWPAYCKFLLFGAQKGELPKNIRIFNKTGDAYGNILDVAYVVDFDKGVEFFLSAVMYCNSDGILNDDQYDYKTIGLPFMKNLGQVIYDYELKREKNNLPDLSGLQNVSGH